MIPWYIAILLLDAGIHFRIIQGNEFINYTQRNLIALGLFVGITAIYAAFSGYDVFFQLAYVPALRWIIHDLWLNYLRGLSWDYLGTRSRTDRFLRKMPVHQIIIKLSFLAVSVAAGITLTHLFS